jgi:TPR repeat protein
MVLAVILLGCASTPRDPTPTERKAKIADFTKCAQMKTGDQYVAATCAYNLGFWAISGWGTSDGKQDKDQFYYWMNIAAEKGHISAATWLARNYIYGYATGKREPEKVMTLINRSYPLFLSGVVDRGMTKAEMDKQMSEGLMYRGGAYANKGATVDARKDDCRALALNPKNVEAEKSLLGGYGNKDKCAEYLRQ